MAAKKKKSVLTPEEEVQNAIASIVVDNEYRSAATLQDLANIDFESLVDMIEGRRTEKDYEWMSDTTIPEAVSILLSEASDWAGQMFQTRDFCEVRLDGDKPEDKNKAAATKKCLNGTLNRRDLYYYHKYIRLRTINALRGHTYALCWWEQESRKEKERFVQIVNEDVDVYGNPIIDKENQVPRRKRVLSEREVDKVYIDQFNFDALDPRNVFTDNKYTYSVQDKDWVIVRSETTYEKLVADKEKNKYFNLDKVKEAIKSAKSVTTTAKETYAKEADGEINKTPVRYFDVLDRYGKFYVKVLERNPGGYPTKIAPGVDNEGFPIDGAELIETIITFVIIGSSKIMIRMVPTPFVDAVGHPYKPLVRGWCYIHPTKDEGLSDGKNMKELQIGIDDMWNMGLDRVKLATLPTFIGKKSAMEDNSTFYFEPEHVIETENPQEDFKEIAIRDNIEGALNTVGMLMGKMQQVTARFPTTMGALPDKSSTTATAVAGAEQRTNTRTSYKSLTFEYTFFVEFYWMILQMTYRFATDETLLKMLGQTAEFFDPYADYTYSPVTSAIEAEQNKYRKVQLYDQMTGRLSGLVQALPELVPIIAHITGRQATLLGDEFQEIGTMIDKLSKAKPREEGETPNQPKDMGMQPTQNQSGMPMGEMEMGTRNAMMQGAIQ